jgi:hypothetical protein
MSGDAIELRIGRLVVDDGALAGIDRAELGERLQAAIGRRLSGAPSERDEGWIGDAAGRIAAEIATVRAGGGK